jgi:hypothetical protein
LRVAAHDAVEYDSGGGGAKPLSNTGSHAPEPAANHAAPKAVPSGAFDSQWYVHLAGQAQGPFSGDEIRQMVREGKIAETDLLCRAGDSAWTQAKNDPIIGPAFSARHPAMVVGGALSAKRVAIPVAAVAVILIALAWFGRPYYAQLTGGAEPRDITGAIPTGRAATAASPDLDRDRDAAFDSDAAVQVGQRAVLYEEDKSDPAGKRYVGSAVWRTERVVPSPGQPPEIAIRADIEIPEQNIALRWSLQRNDDKGLPASHTVEVRFTLPPDFPHGSISNVPGLRMKQSESSRGEPLVGLAVKVTANFFLVGLSAADADVRRNLYLLRQRPWLDIPFLYEDGKRAIIAVEKGVSGDRAFAEAMLGSGDANESNILSTPRGAGR